MLVNNIIVGRCVIITRLYYQEMDSRVKEPFKKLNYSNS